MTATTHSTTGHLIPAQAGLPGQTAALDKFPKFAFPIRELMAAWPLGGWSHIHWMSAGKNEHAELTTGAGRFFLRRSYRSKSLAALQFQVALLDGLRANGFPTPEPVPTIDGEHILAIWEDASAEKAAQDRLYMVTVALPGSAFDGTDVDLLRTMGRELARYHRVVDSLDLTHPHPEDRHLLRMLQDKLASMDASAAPDLHERGTEIDARLSGLWPALPRTIIHGGVRRGSLLFSGPEISGFLDLDSARPGPRCLDLATAAHDIGKVYTEKGREDHKVVLDLAKIKVFLDGYRELAPISEAEAEAIGVMIEAKRVRRAMGRAERLDNGEALSANDLAKIELERSRLAWLHENLPDLHAICAA